MMDSKRVQILVFGLTLICAFSLTSFKHAEPPHCKFKFDHFRSLKKIPEPSDVVFDPETQHLFVVSDHGKLFECDTLGNVIRKAQEEGLDFEGLEVKDSFIYVSDETPRKIYQYRKNDLSLVQIYSVSWQGALNKAFESICYNKAKNCFVLVSQEPAVIVEYDKDFRDIRRYPFHATRDINGARWYNGFVYLLSAKDECILKCDPNNYTILERYNINVYNPEGLAFDAAGKVYITSDDLQRMYFFNQLPIISQK